jgi:hypothetical protein
LESYNPLPSDQEFQIRTWRQRIDAAEDFEKIIKQVFEVNPVAQQKIYGILGTAAIALKSEGKGYRNRSAFVDRACDEIVKAGSEILLSQSSQEVCTQTYHAIVGEFTDLTTVDECYRAFIWEQRRVQAPSWSSAWLSAEAAN